MAPKIIWNKRALNDLRKIIQYLRSEWTYAIAVDYLTRIDKIIEIISKNPEIGKIQVSKRNVRGFVIVEHATLFYKVKPGKIFLVRIFDNRQNPNKKQL